MLAQAYLHLAGGFFRKSDCADPRQAQRSTGGTLHENQMKDAIDEGTCLSRSRRSFDNKRPASLLYRPVSAVLDL